MNRLLVLDSLRGIAAILVVIFHYLYRYGEIYGHDFSSVDWVEYGEHGVSLFFMISGFVIYWRLDHALVGPRWEGSLGQVLRTAKCREPGHQWRSDGTCVVAIGEREP